MLDTRPGEGGPSPQIANMRRNKIGDLGRPGIHPTDLSPQSTRDIGSYLLPWSLASIGSP